MRCIRNPDQWVALLTARRKRIFVKISLPNSCLILLKCLHLHFETDQYLYFALCFDHLHFHDVLCFAW